MTQIPLKTLLSHSRKSSGHFLAKTGICFKSNKQTSYIYGFGFNNEIEKAKKSSQFEALEHLYASDTLHQGKENFVAYSLKSPDEHKIFSPTDVLIFNAHTFREKSADANGLGCHQKIEQAIKHAILELIERHLLAEIWYGKGMVYEVIEKSIIREDGWHVRYYSLYDYDVPLAIAIVSNSDEDVWILGSALRESFEQALEHAKNEAFMLLESTFIENGVAYSAEIEYRLSSLKNKIYSKNRREFFQSKVVNKINVLDIMTGEYPITDIIDKTLGKNPIWIVNLVRNNHINVVRALCDFAKNPRWFRRPEYHYVPLDPFC